MPWEENIPIELRNALVVRQKLPPQTVRNPQSHELQLTLFAASILVTTSQILYFQWMQKTHHGEVRIENLIHYKLPKLTGSRCSLAVKLKCQSCQ